MQGNSKFLYQIKLFEIILIATFFFKLFLFYLQTVNNPCTNLLTAHFRLDGHPHINPLQKVIQASKQTHLLFNPSQGDLHSYVRVRKRLREAEARRLFRQMCTTVKSCHEQGIVLRDLKLRKFIFADHDK